MDLNKDHKLTFDEFKEGSKQDPTIVQVGNSSGFIADGYRRCSCTTASCRLVTYRLLIDSYVLFSLTARVCTARSDA